MAQTILIVDDDADIRAIIGLHLRRADFRPREAATGREALSALDEGPVDLVILDVVLPDADGRDLLREIRARAAVPVVFLSRRGAPGQRIEGLELGADDYIPKPFEPRELVARVHAVLRRGRDPQADRPDELCCGRLRLHVDRHEVAWDGAPLDLTKTEFGILHTLMAQPRRVFTRQEIIEQAYEDQTVVSERTIDSHVRRIRDKLRDVGAQPIETVHGVGFRLDADQV